MKRSVVLMIALVTLFVAVIILGDFVPSIVSHPSYDQGCSCMNGGISIYINETDVYVAFGFDESVVSGESYSLLIRTAEPAGVKPAIMIWVPDMGDNAKFTFDPQEVKDNSPNDTNPDNGAITALFKVTAPKEPGSYLTPLSTQRGEIPIHIEVKSNLPGSTTAITTSMASTTTPIPIDTSALSEKEKYWLAFMREEEKLARDVYKVLGDEWDSKILRDISVDEQRHMNILEPLFANHNVTDPTVGKGPGVFTNSNIQKLYNDLLAKGSVSKVEAINVGITIEGVDIEDLTKALAVTTHEDLKAAFVELRRGSDIHMTAFKFDLSKQTTTTPQESGGIFTTTNIIIIVVVVAAVAVVGAFLLRRRRK